MFLVYSDRKLLKFMSCLYLQHCWVFCVLKKFMKIKLKFFFFK